MLVRRVTELHRGRGHDAGCMSRCDGVGVGVAGWTWGWRLKEAEARSRWHGVTFAPQKLRAGRQAGRQASLAMDRTVVRLIINQHGECSAPD